ncbi:hypothetical protein KUTeg_000749 [Tegillarca granosa]|uniref:C2H2-type domain-containing protein n=1 Tax=Tegillarca granosa TaxID=220873 RepID=A0ABQ9FYF6_TEGGR|nr:hypothetical protein KUTeg_000749 [Tegillarca granosa]
MSNALLMGYHNQQQQLAAAGMAMNLASMFPTLPPSTSEIPPHSAGFTPSSSQSPAESQQHQNAEQALNLCVQKPALNDQFNHITGSLSPVSERPRSRSYSGSDIAKPLMVSVPSMTANCQDVGIQTKTCCKAGTESILYGMRSPSETSLQSGDSGANYQNVSNSGIDYSTESMASLLSSGRMFKCDHCESYFSEYAMYRIHAKLHVRGGRALPFTCFIIVIN